MSSTCCACRWVGTVSTMLGTCPRCGEKCFADGVVHAVTFRSAEHPHLGESRSESPAGTPLTEEELAFAAAHPPHAEGDDSPTVEVTAEVTAAEPVTGEH